jgi:hypothetical protein
MNFVVGTDLAHMTGKSIVAARRHRILGHVDIRLGLLMVLGTVPGIEIGARIIERLESAGNIDTVVVIAYIVILLAIGAFTAWESVRALQLVRTERMDAREALAFEGVTRRVHRLRLPPHISLPASGIESISLWVVLGVSFLTGLLAGVLGVGGGFIRMPLMIYLIGGLWNCDSWPQGQCGCTHGPGHGHGSSHRCADWGGFDEILCWAADQALFLRAAVRRGSVGNSEVARRLGGTLGNSVT